MERELQKNAVFLDVRITCMDDVYAIAWLERKNIQIVNLKLILFMSIVEKMGMYFFDSLIL